MVCKNNLVYTANAIARALGHGHALPKAVAADLWSIRALHYRWKAEGANRNDQMLAEQQGVPGLEGWAAVEGLYNGPYASTYRSIVALEHQTATGRLLVSIIDDGRLREACLIFCAGPAEPGGVPGLVLRLTFHPELLHNLNASMEITVYPEFLEGRPDRLELLWKIDEELDDCILRALELRASQPPEYAYQLGAAVLLASRDALQAVSSDKSAY